MGAGKALSFRSTHISCVKQKHFTTMRVIFLLSLLVLSLITAEVQVDEIIEPEDTFAEPFPVPTTLVQEAAAAKTKPVASQEAVDKKVQVDELIEPEDTFAELMQLSTAHAHEKKEEEKKVKDDRKYEEEKKWADKGKGKIKKDAAQGVAKKEEEEQKRKADMGKKKEEEQKRKADMSKKEEEKKVKDDRKYEEEKKRADK